MVESRSVLSKGTLVLVLCAAVLGWCRPAFCTALDDYVAAPDASYNWRLVKTIPGTGYTGYVLDMTSQTWRTSAEVDRTRWQHWVTIIKPETVKSSKALLVISGGRNGRRAPSSVSGMLGGIAVTTNSVLVELGMIPNQPLTFIGDETRPRSEDSLIAYTWDKYLKTGDDRWPARLPMTKAAVRAMDAVQTFCGSGQGGNVTIDGFVVAGGSKRGWTTWTTAAVDPRVVAIVPISIDVLNVELSMRHHHASYGFWARAIGNYVEKKIMDWMGTPEFRALMDIVDPYVYRDRYTMPKYVISASGDEFFLPDSSQFYFDDLPGEKYLRYVPNTDHGLDDSDAVMSLTSYYQAILNGTPRPQFSWTKQADGSIRVKTVDTPTKVSLWQMTNPKARDFRKETFGAHWTSSPVADEGDGVYTGRVPEPQEGWTAFFVELTFKSGGPFPFKFTTEVSVVPDRLPYA